MLWTERLVPRARPRYFPAFSMRQDRTSGCLCACLIKGRHSFDGSPNIFDRFDRFDLFDVDRSDFRSPSTEYSISCDGAGLARAVPLVRAGEN
jgi:hypothetical protein